MRRTDSLGGIPAIMLTTAALALTFTVSALTGALTPPQEAEPDSPDATPVEQVTHIHGTAPPAQHVIANTLGKNIRWGVKAPIGAHCTVPTAPISAQAGYTSMHAYPAGQGTAVFNALKDCGYATTVNDAPAVRITVPGGSVVAWARGDVITTLATSPNESASDVDSTLMKHLAPACLDFTPSATDARRNYLHPRYRGWIITEEVTVTPLAPPVLDPPDPDDTAGEDNTQDITPPTLDTELPSPTPLEPPTLPEGVAGPPLPAPVEQPVAPTHPGPQPVADTVKVTQPDPDGPGCGWAFTGQRPPVVDTEALNVAATLVRDAAHADLADLQATWFDSATRYLSEAFVFLRSLAAWEQYVVDVEGIADEWQEQRRALDVYEAQLDAYDKAVAAYEQFIADQDQARRDYDEALRKCAPEPDPTPTPTPSPTPTPTPTPSPAPTPTPTPTPTPEPDPQPEPEPDPTADAPPTPETLPASLTTPATTCPERPKILDETPPTIPTVPTPPTLWTAP